jgi:hypothetical protein
VHHYILGLGNGNLYAAKGENNFNKRGICGTLGASTGKWYFEIDTMLSNNNECLHFGIVEASSSLEMLCTVAPAGYGSLYKVNGEQYVYSGGAPAKVGAGLVFPRENCVGAVAMDLDAGTLQYYMEGAATGPQLKIAVGSHLYYTPWVHFGGGDGHCSLNAGQRPFKYAPPAGFKALCTTNLPMPSITDGKKHFDIALGAGAGILAQAQALTPHDLIWIKDRRNNANHQIIDIVRGLTSAIKVDEPSAVEAPYAAPAGESVAWAWKAGGAAVANTGGTIASQVSANKCGGVSVVTYTGNGVAGATIGHGLGVPPTFILTRRRHTAGAAGSGVWGVYHKDVGNTGSLFLNTTAGPNLNQIVYWNNTSPTSTVFSVGTNELTNRNADAYIAYCFAEIEGFSRFDWYLGSTASDGPYAYTGFTPKYVMWKRADGASEWAIVDSSRAAHNLSTARLQANSWLAEDTAGGIDLLSNGFKIRAPQMNAHGAKYIYAAFAEHPFKIALAR